MKPNLEILAAINRNRPCIELNGEPYPFVGLISERMITIDASVKIKPIDVFTFGASRFVVMNIFQWSREPFKRIEFVPAP